MWRRVNLLPCALSLMHRYKSGQYSIADDFLEIRLDLLEVHLLLVVLNMIRFCRHLGRLGWV